MSRPWPAAIMLLHMTAASAPAQQHALAEIGFARGDDRADVVAIEFLDFSCSVCAQFAVQGLPLIDPEYIQTGRVRWIAVPFVLGTFANSEAATRAAICAGDQDAFWAMHDLLFTDRSWVSAGDPDADLRAMAASAGVDTALFDACILDRRTRDRVRRAGTEARRAGVTGTPTFLINGRVVIGAPPLPLFRRMLDDATVPPDAGRAGRSNPSGGGPT